MRFDPPSRGDDREATSPPDVIDEPPVDRMAVHLVWEIGLLLLGGGVLFALTQASEGPFAEARWGGLAAALAPFILLGSAAAVSLRVGAVNLAVGPIALFSAWIFTDASGSGTTVALGMALGAAGFVGIALATLCAWLRVPGWAASGAVGGAIGLWASAGHEPAGFMLAELPGSGVLAALGGAIGLSVFMGLVGAFAGVRDRLAPIRDTPGGDRHGRGGTVFVGVLLSSCLAGAGGILIAWAPVVEQGPRDMPDLILLSVMALAAALLGGTSLHGRRGGVCGTVFAALLLLSLMWLVEARGWGFDPSWIALGAVVAGFPVTRLIEAMNTPDAAEAASTSRAGEVDDLRDDDPPPPSRHDAPFEEYDEDFAAVGSGADPWSTTGAVPRAADPFGASGVFDDLRDPRPGDGFEQPGGARYDDGYGRFGR